MVAAVAGVETAVVVVTLPNAVANLLVGWRTRHGIDLSCLGLSTPSPVRQQ